MEWNFEEKRWYILLKMWEFAEYHDIDYYQMDAISIFPVLELLDNYEDIIPVIIEISDNHTDAAIRIINAAHPDVIINGIDVLIECAIDFEMHEITALLLDYKYKHGEFKEKDWRL